jgi:hypothetical protein
MGQYQLYNENVRILLSETSFTLIKQYIYHRFKHNSIKACTGMEQSSTYSEVRGATEKPYISHCSFFLLE